MNKKIWVICTWVRVCLPYWVTNILCQHSDLRKACFLYDEQFNKDNDSYIAISYISSHQLKYSGKHKLYSLEVTPLDNSYHEGFLLINFQAYIFSSGNLFLWIDIGNIQKVILSFIHLLSQSVSQSVRQSVSQSTSQSVSLSVCLYLIQ